MASQGHRPGQVHMSHEAEGRVIEHKAPGAHEALVEVKTKEGPTNV